MNKLLKYLLVGLAVVSVSVACTQAVSVEDLITYVGEEQSFTLSYQGIKSIYTLDSTNSTYCLEISELTNTLFIGWHNPLSYDVNYGTRFGTNSEYVCITPYNANNNYLYIYNPVNSSTKITFKLFKLNSLFSTSIPVYTSLECQTEYNLIPISEVTANYCRLNFDLIDPMECPINSGTGTIVRSNLTINDTPYAQNQNINVFIPDFLAWNISFNDFTTAIEVEGYNADTDYIENVINNEKLTPTNEDFAGMLTGLVNLAPYLFITLLMFFFIRLINKIWK